MDEKPTTNCYENPGPGFTTAKITMKDRSVWQITKPLSNRKYQRFVCPSEARQVFTCICVEDPEGKYRDFKEAVIKAKYQVTSSVWGINRADQEVSNAEQDVKLHSSNPKKPEETTGDLQRARGNKFAATHPVQNPHFTTWAEYRALKCFARQKCSCTPQLLGLAVGWIEEGVDEAAIVGGYVRFFLMTKVPGRQLRPEEFHALPLSERNALRESFKTGMLELWRLGIWPKDEALRNLLWDEETRKCSIVDFESYDFSDRIEGSILDDGCGETEYNLWGISDGAAAHNTLGLVHKFFSKAEK